MPRRSERSPGLKVRVSHEATRLSKVHVAAAFERLVPILERQTRPPCADDDVRWIETAGTKAKPMKGR
jgi:hypothetical protein